MESRRVGRSGLDVSRIALGTMTWGRDTDAEAAATSPREQVNRQFSFEQPVAKSSGGGSSGGEFGAPAGGGVSSGGSSGGGGAFSFEK